MAGYYPPSMQTDEEKPKYFEELTLENISDFELMNSLYSLKNFDNLLFLLENVIEDEEGERLRIVVPSFNMLCVLYTLATLSPHHLDKRLKKIQNHSVIDESLQTRSLNLINQYVMLLQDFDTKRYSEKDLLLLRSQFFILIDFLFELDIKNLTNFKTTNAFNISYKRKKTSFYEKFNDYDDNFKSIRFHSNVKMANLKKKLSELQYLNSVYYPRLVSPFHINDSNSLKILDNLLLPLQFTTEGFWNSVELNIACLKVTGNSEALPNICTYWVPILSSIFQILIMRDHFYIKYEISGDIYLKPPFEKLHNYDSAKLLPMLKMSPIATVFESLRFHGWNNKFKDVLFPGNPKSNLKCSRSFYQDEFDPAELNKKRTPKTKSSQNTPKLEGVIESAYQFCDNTEQDYSTFVTTVLTCFNTFNKRVGYYTSKINSLSRSTEILVFSDNFYKDFAFFFVKGSNFDPEFFQTMFSVDAYLKIAKKDFTEYDFEFLNLSWFISISCLLYIGYDELEQRIFHISELPKYQEDMYAFIVDMAEETKDEKPTDFSQICIHNLMSVFFIIRNIYTDLIDITLYDNFLKDMNKYIT